VNIKITPVSNEIEQILEANYDREPFIELFSNAFVLSYEKCEKYISNHPALSLLKAIQCLDPTSKVYSIKYSFL
jgi:hypothetical protein